MKKNTMYKIIRTIAIIAVVAAFLLICTGCDGGRDAIGYHGPSVVRPGFIY